MGWADRGSRRLRGNRMIVRLTKFEILLYSIYSLVSEWSARAGYYFLRATNYESIQIYQCTNLRD